jgi:hypothetical protein
MATSDTVQERNEDLARRIHAEARRDPNSLYCHKYVVIANGRDVVVAEDLDELILRLQQVEPDPEKCYCVWIDPKGDFSADNEIWESP